MTNYAELIAEAERMIAHDAEVEFDDDRLIDARIVAALAAAVRELAPPEGWRATEYVQLDTYKHVFLHNNDEWRIVGDKTKPRRSFPTASAAMAALDGGE